MLKFYGLKENILYKASLEEARRNTQELVWIDMLNPTMEEERQIEEMITIPIPTRDEMHEIELSSRLYQENGAVYATATIVTNTDTNQPESHAVSFVLYHNCLVTIRYVDPTSFKILSGRIENNEIRNPSGIRLFSIVMELIVDRQADVLENIGRNIDVMTKKIFKAKIKDAHKTAKTSPDFENLIYEIGINGDLVSKTRESMVSINRLISYVCHTPDCKSDEDAYERFNTALRDIVPLNDHANFLSGKLSFLLDATLGMISNQQNGIIKIFSVAAVVFLPPTLIASIYGMNFDFIPELKWHIGYPVALIMMVLSSYLPYKYFKHKGWL